MKKIIRRKSNLALFNMVFYIQISVLLVGCSSKYLETREKEFGTKGKHKWSFHRLSDRDKGTTLAFPGYIVSLEKARRKKIGAPSKSALKKDSALAMFGFNEDNYTWKTLSRQKRMILNDGKPTFVSSIISFQLSNSIVPHISQKVFYDAYDSIHYLPQAKNAYSTGFDYLNQFGDSILEKVERDSITHIFMYSMGWNTDQQESIRNFNSLYLKLLEQVEKSKAEFRPLLIGFTWDSKWPFPGVSLFNKSNDADEIGMIWANVLLNKKLLSIDNPISFKTVLVGHSLGAKLTSRMTMSASMLTDTTKAVDLLINLESAYSINRFSLKQSGFEQTKDYQEWYRAGYVKNIALTCSSFDKAVKNGVWAPYAGNTRAYKRIKKPKNKDKFENFDTLGYFSETSISFNDGRILYIDASSIINKTAYKKGGKAHSDIYNDEVSKLIWKLIESSTY